IRYVNFGREPEAQPGLDGYQALILLGGPMNLDQESQYPHLSYETRLVEEAIQRDMPVLGICLGAQIVAKALGAEVGKNPEKEIGWYPIEITAEGQKDPVLKHFQSQEWIFQWHGDTFKIPQGTSHLATSPTCPNQAFRYGDKVYGFQFHMEADEALIERWLKVPRHLEELEALKGKVDPEEIRTLTPKHVERLKELSELTFSEFLRIFGEDKKYLCPPSR
ncbi:MAG: type 1 glutamine amidotransferase, partial [bacterium]|nr:type 1 glutamine amidotransferase [bacterium]